MVKSKKAVIIFVLSIYTFLFFLANSPIHLYIFPDTIKLGLHEETGPPVKSFLRPEALKNNIPVCPLCSFMKIRLSVVPETIQMSFLCTGFRYLRAFTHDNPAYVSPISYYDILAPPSRLS